MSLCTHKKVCSTGINATGVNLCNARGMCKQLQCHRYQLACKVKTNKSCVGECIITRVTNLVTALLIIHNRSLKGLVWLAVDLVDLCRMHLLIGLCVHTCLDHCLLYCFVSAKSDV
jgi:hypothetical protein